jgi:nucleotide-binding universal stress UspA family protein
VASSRLYARQEDRARIRAHVELSATAAELSRVRVRVSHVVIDGRPVSALHERAVERHARLLVTGTAVRQGLAHVLQGSVAGRLAASAPCPVVTVPPDGRVAERGPVLVGDDGSDHAHRAVRHATWLAQRMGRDLIRMNVAAGDPALAIGDAGRAQQACLVVVGTRGRGPLRAELFGSVSIGLVQTAARPVVLVPASARA